MTCDRTGSRPTTDSTRTQKGTMPAERKPAECPARQTLVRAPSTCQRILPSAGSRDITLLGIDITASPRLGLQIPNCSEVWLMHRLALAFLLTAYLTLALHAQSTNATLA